MDTKCLILRKVKSIFFGLFIILSCANAQDNGMDTLAANIEKVNLFEGEYSFYDKNNFLLALKSHDTLVHFKIHSFFLAPESYSTFLEEKEEWNNLSVKTYLRLDYYVQVYYDFDNNKLKHNLVCLNIETINKPNEYNRIPEPRYDTNVYNTVGFLKRVELGDYLHVTVSDENSEHISYWVSSSINEETRDKLYTKMDMDINLKVKIKHCKTVTFIPEAGGPVAQDQCIDMQFLE